MSRIYLGLGTNLGDKSQNLVRAEKLLTERVGKLLMRSGVIETTAVGFESDNTFLNCVILMETELNPYELLKVTQQIEKDLGRSSKSNGSYADRIIDIDILYYDDLIIDLPELKIPHPLISERDFVKIPLKELGLMEV